MSKELNLDQQIDLKNLENDIRNKLAQEHNWQMQEEHYIKQQNHWKWISILAVLAIIANAAKPIIEVWASRL